MRVSIYRGEPGHVGWQGGRYRVMLDGAEVSRPVRADDELGIVWRQMTDESGRAVLNRHHDGVIIERVHGTVEIVDTWGPWGTAWRAARRAARNVARAVRPPVRSRMASPGPRSSA